MLYITIAKQFLYPELRVGELSDAVNYVRITILVLRVRAYTVHTSVQCIRPDIHTYTYTHT